MISFAKVQFYVSSEFSFPKKLFGIYRPSKIERLEKGNMGVSFQAGRTLPHCQSGNERNRKDQNSKYAFFVTLDILLL